MDGAAGCTVVGAGREENAKACWESYKNRKGPAPATVGLSAIHSCHLGMLLPVQCNPPVPHTGNAGRDVHLHTHTAHTCTHIHGTCAHTQHTHKLNQSPGSHRSRLPLTGSEIRRFHLSHPSSVTSPKRRERLQQKARTQSGCSEAHYAGHAAPTCPQVLPVRLPTPLPPPLNHLASSVSLASAGTVATRQPRPLSVSSTYLKTIMEVFTSLCSPGKTNSVPFVCSPCCTFWA